MKNEIPDHSVFVRYLLGELPDEESRQLERECLDDDAVFEQLEAIEAELTDDYVRGDLRGAQRERFEQRLAANPAAKRGIELSRLLTSAAAAPPRRMNANVVRALALAAGLILAVLSGWFWISRPQSKPVETAAVHSIPAAPPPLPAIAPKFAKRSSPARQPADKAFVPAAGAAPPPPVVRQSVQQAAVSGKVVDQSGAVIGGATVTLTDRLSGTEKTATTNRDGVYSIPSLPAGSYDLKATASGFAEVEKSALQLPSSDQTTTDLAMPVAPASSTVTVSAAPPEIEVRAARSAQTRALRTLSKSLPDGLTETLRRNLGPGVNGQQLYLQMLERRGDMKEIRVAGIEADESELTIEFSAPVATGATLADAKDAIDLALTGKQLNASREEAYAALAAYLNQTCCGNSVTPATIIVNGPQGPIAGSLKTSEDRRFVTFTPNQPFELRVHYRVVIQNVKDLAGRPMKKPYKKTFSLKR